MSAPSGAEVKEICTAIGWAGATGSGMGAGAAASVAGAGGARAGCEATCTTVAGMELHNSRIAFSTVRCLVAVTKSPFAANSEAPSTLEAAESANPARPPKANIAERLPPSRRNSSVKSAISARLVTVTLGQTLTRSACISTTLAFGPFSTCAEAARPWAMKLPSCKGSSVTNTFGLSCTPAGTAGATGSALAAAGTTCAVDAFVSCAKDDGTRTQQTRRRLRHCFTIKFLH